MMKYKKIFLYAQEVCTKRSLDTTKIRNYLTQNKYIIVNSPDDADIIIFVTCAVGDRNTNFSLKKIKEFQKYKAEIIVAGCLPEIEKEQLAQIFKGKTISTKELDKIDKFFPENTIKSTELEDTNILFENKDESTLISSVRKILRKVRLLEWIENEYIDVRNYILRDLLGEQSPVYKSLTRKQFYIRILWGCLGNCSYCGIKKAIGPLKSKPITECINEFKKGLQQGYKSFTITADDVGAYGLDINKNLPELLDKLTKIKGDYEINITDLHPRWIVKYIDELEKILRRKKIIFIDVPFQSGNDRILKLMNRYSDTEKMKNCFIRLKKAFPGLSLTTQNIVGFPTETEKEFKDTLKFIKDIDFKGGLIYRFSCKSGTDAEDINPKVNDDIMSDRLKYAKKFLRSIGCVVFYRSIFYSPRFYRCLGFIKK